MAERIAQMVEAGQGSGIWARLRRRWEARREREAVVLALYQAIIEAAREPTPFAAWGVPDTGEGRFELIGLHAALVMRRLRHLGRRGTLLSQELFDLMMADMDRNLREMGVGDLSIGRNVKAMAATFLARAQAVDAALQPPGAAAPDLAAPDLAALGQVLLRNVYSKGPAPTAGQVAALARAVAWRDAQLARLAADRLLAGHLPASDRPAGAGESN